MTEIKLADKPAIVYKVTNTVTGDFYIGCTTKPIEKRMAQHKSNAYKKPKSGKNIKLWDAIKEYSIDSFKMEILVSGLVRKEALAEELRLIKLLKPEYNEVIRTRIPHWTGKQRSEECKKKISATKLGVPNPISPRFLDAHRNRTIERNKLMVRPIVCLNDNKTYPSIKEAAIFYFGKTDSHISEVCRGKMKSTRGLRFKYIE